MAAIPPSLPVKGQFSSSSTVLTAQSSVAPSQAPTTPNHVFTSSGIAVKKSAPTPIYKWEGSDGVKKDRTEIEVNDKVYVPSSENAVYVQHDGKNVGKGVENQFIDFQVVLTKEEMETLAARRKKLLKTATANVKNTSSVNSNSHVIKSHVASMSINATLPYVDPKRVQQELFIKR